MKNFEIEKLSQRHDALVLKKHEGADIRPEGNYAVSEEEDKGKRENGRGRERETRKGKRRRGKETRKEKRIRGKETMDKGGGERGIEENERKEGKGEGAGAE